MYFYAQCPSCYGYLTNQWVVTPYTPCVCTYSGPLYPSNSTWHPVRGSVISHSRELVPIIIEFNGKALLEKHPGLKVDEFKSHPYRQQLASEYSDWINQIQEKLGLPHFNVRHKFDLLVSGIAVTLPKDQAEKLGNLQLPFIKTIYSDKKMTADTETITWHHSRIQQEVVDLNKHNLELIGVPAVHKLTDTSGSPLDGRGVRVAVLDHGFDTTRLRFGPEGRVVNQYNLEDNNSNVLTPGVSDHGTMVTQILLDVAPNAQILAYKTMYGSSVVAGLERAAEEKAKVVNISLEATSEFNLLIAAANRAEENGVSVVNSSGNNSRANYVSDPGSSERIVSVGATNPQGNQVAVFSNYDAALLKPDVVAPGFYQYKSKIYDGTSIAAPYVSGAVALILQRNPDLTSIQIMSALVTTARPILERDPSAFFSQGSGMVAIPSAIKSNTFFSPSRINLYPTWGRSTESSLRIENRSDTDETYQLNWVAKKADIEISFPSSITAPARSSTYIPISVKTSPESNSFLERICFSAGGMQWHVPVHVKNTGYIDAGSPIYSVAFRPDGRVIASGSQDGRVQLWDLEVSETRPTYSLTVGDIVNSIAFSPDGKLIATGSQDGKVQLWMRIFNTQALFSFDAGSSVNSIAFHPDGRLIASGSEDGRVQLWGFSGSGPTHSFDTNDSVVSVAFSPDGKFIAAGLGREIQIFDLSTQSQLPLSIIKTDNYVNSVTFSPDRPFVAAGLRGGGIEIWDFLTPAMRPSYSFTAGTSVYSIAFSRDGKSLAAGTRGKQIQVWDLYTDNPNPGRVIVVGSIVSSIAFSPDGKLIASGSDDGKLRLWNV